MKIRLLAFTALAVSLPLTSRAQILISEFLTNPSGGDSPFEWVELIATDNINFAATPFSVVFSDNGATRFGTNGWLTGSGVTYGFDLISGSVNRGDVFYVGGSSMAPVSNRLRTIDTGTQPGDGGLGIAANGVLGNGGGVADGIAVFNQNIANLTPSLNPIDAIFFGQSPTGNVFLTAYTLPNNDLYPGGSLTVESFVAPDPGGGTLFASGIFNTETNGWEMIRQWNLGTLTEANSGITLTPVPEPGTIALIVIGSAAGALWMQRRRRR